MKTLSGAGNGWTTDADASDRGIWKNTIAAASHALETVALIEHGVGMTLRLQRKVRELRERLRTTQAELDRYRDLHAHAHALAALRAAEPPAAEDTGKHLADGEALRMRHRAYKLLIEHYACTGSPIDLAVFAAQRRQVLQHILFQQRRGVPPARISVDDIAFLLR
ncbi:MULTISPECIES: hypothetical protein [Cupriavidus]